MCNSLEREKVQWKQIKSCTYGVPTAGKVLIGSRVRRVTGAVNVPVAVEKDRSLKGVSSSLLRNRDVTRKAMPSKSLHWERGHASLVFF